MADETILIVEDTELIRRMYHDRLELDGYTVLVAENGQECLNLLRSNHVNLVLLDLIMPVMGGLEALIAMKSDPRTKDIPVIILSNLGQAEDVQHGVELGATDYLIKSSSKPEDVSDKIRLTLDAMGGRAEEQEPIRVLLRDHEAGADDLVKARGLIRRFWCPTCEKELVLELLSEPERSGWFAAHLLCPTCGKEY